MRWPSLAVGLFAWAIASPAFGQLVVELPFDAGVPEREVISSTWRKSSEPIASPASRPALALPSPDRSTRPTVSLRKEKESEVPLVSRSITLAESIPEKIAAFLSLPPPAPVNPTVLSTFNGSAADGGIRANTTWVGQVTQGSGYITIGGTASNDNGWGTTGLLINATGLNTLSITAQRDPGHGGGPLVFQFEDHRLITSVFSVNSSLFAVGTPTQVQIVLGTWTGDFDFTQITGWSLGGGGLATQDFRMSLHHVELTATAIPEPSTYAAILGAALLGIAVLRRRRKR